MIKKITFVFMLLFAVSSFSQTTTIQLDYSVSYEVINARKVNDTISISFDEEGNYFYTNTKSLAKDLARSFFKYNQTLINNSNINILFDVRKELLFINFESDSNYVFFKMNVNDLLPNTDSKKDTIDPKEIELVSEPTNKKVTVLDSEYNLYKIFPSHETDKPIYVAIDKINSFNINHLIYFFAKKFSLAENLLLKPIHIPKGIIMLVKNHKEDTILKIINVKKQPKKIEFNHSFTID